MLLLASTSDRLQLVTDTNTPVDVHASYLDTSSGGVTPGRKNTTIAAGATTDVVVPPGAGVSRTIKTLHVRNTHATLPVVVTVQHTDGTTVVELEKVTLLAGEEIAYTDGHGFRIFAADGSVKGS